MCRRFYEPGDAYYNGSTLSGLNNVFRRVTNRFARESDDPICVDLVTRYLCHYYFPLCNATTDEIIPVCSRSCTLLTNNPNCLILRGIANEEIGQENLVATGDSCNQTYRSYVNPPPVSESCFSIEG